MPVSTKTKVLYRMAMMSLKSAAKEALDNAPTAANNLISSAKNKACNVYNKIARKIDVKEINKTEKK
jgi:hypothetical protein